MPNRICPSRSAPRSKCNPRCWPRAGQKTQAIALLQSALRTYGNTSIHDRLAKESEPAFVSGKARAALEVAISFWERSCPRPRN